MSYLTPRHCNGRQVKWMHSRWWPSAADRPLWWQLERRQRHRYPQPHCQWQVRSPCAQWSMCCNSWFEPDQAGEPLMLERPPRCAGPTQPPLASKFVYWLHLLGFAFVRHGPLFIFHFWWFAFSGTPLLAASNLRRFARYSGRICCLDPWALQALATQFAFPRRGQLHLINLRKRSVRSRNTRRRAHRSHTFAWLETNVREGGSFFCWMRTQENWACYVFLGNDMIIYDNIW